MRNGMVRLSIVLCLMCWPALLSAQTATPSSKLLVDQAAPDLASANGYTYRYYPDGVATGVVISMVCTGTVSPFVCSAAFPAFTPGSHSLTLTAANIAGESAKSTALTFQMVVTPSAPVNPRIG